MEEKNIKKNLITDKFLFILVLFVIILIKIIPCFFIKSINSTTDEFTVIGTAAHLAGLDWSGTVRQSLYYGYVTSLLYTPFFKIPFLVARPQLLCRCLLLVNSAISICNFILIYKSVSIICKEKNIGKRTILFIASLISIMPTLNAYEKQLTNETVYFFCYTVVFYCLLKEITVKSKISILYVVISGIFSVLCYATNSRGLTLIFIATLSQIYILKVTKKLYYPLIYFLVLILFVIIHKYVKGEVSIVHATTNTISNTGMISELISLFTTVDGLKRLAIGFVGIGTASTIGTFGIIFFVFIGFVNYLRKKEFSDVENITIIFSIILFAASFVLSLAGLPLEYKKLLSAISTGIPYATQRGDKLFYDRYVSVSYPFFTIMFVIWLKKKLIPITKKTALVYITISLCLYKLFVSLILAHLKGTFLLSASPILGQLISLTSEDYRFFSFTNTHFAILIALLLIGVLYYILNTDKKFLPILYLYFILCFIYIISFQVIPKSDYFSSIVNQQALEYTDSHPDTVIMASTDDDYLYQFNAMEKTIISRTNMDYIYKLDDNTNVLVLDSKTAAKIAADTSIYESVVIGDAYYPLINKSDLVNYLR